MTEQNSPVSSYCTAFVLSIAWGIGCAVALILQFAIYDQFLDARVRAESPAVAYEQIVVTPSGKPLIQVGGARNPIQTLDADRNPVERDSSLLTLIPAMLSDAPSDALYALRNVYQFELQRVQIIAIQDKSADWYFLLQGVTSNRGHFVAYDSVTCRTVGFLGPDGFRNTPIPLDEQFDVDASLFLKRSRPGMLDQNDLERIYDVYNNEQIGFNGDYPLTKNQILFQATTGVYLIDFKQKTVDSLLNGKDVISLGAVGQLAEFPDAQNAESPWTHLLKLSLMARTPNSVILFDPRKSKSIEYRLPDQLAKRRLDVYRPADNSLIFLSQVEDSFRELRPGGGESKVEYVRILPNGEILDRKILTRHFPRGISHADEKTVMNIVSLSVPGTLTTTLFAGGLLPLLDDREPKPFSEKMAEMLAVTWPAILIATLISAALCRFVVRRQAEYHFPRNYGWVAFVFLLGVPGYLGYRFHRKWPLKERPPAPVRTGCEVFAA